VAFKNIQMMKSKLPVFLFYGAEEFLIAEAVEKFKRQVADPSFNLEILDGTTLPLETLSASLRTQPLLGGAKLVVVNDFEVETKEQDELISFLKAIPPELKVIFCAEAIDKRAKIYKFFVEQGEVVEFKTFAPWEQEELLGWIKERVQSAGKKISYDAARVLKEITGSNLRLLAGEIAKIITYLGSRPEIAEADVLALAAAGETSAFSLMDALRGKDLKSAQILWQSLQRNKEDVFSLIGLMASQYRIMLQVKSLAGRESDPNKIARLIGGSPYYIKKCAGGLGRFTLTELKQNMSLLLEAGVKLKTGEDQAATFDLLLAELCQR
jgi:DNA polymerase III subunit delta